jgi:hypothetical protein
MPCKAIGDYGLIGKFLQAFTHLAVTTAGLALTEALEGAKP